jgi:hypothetical protein
MQQVAAHEELAASTTSIERPFPTLLFQLSGSVASPLARYFVFSPWWVLEISKSGGSVDWNYR